MKEAKEKSILIEITKVNVWIDLFVQGHSLKGDIDVIYKVE